MAGIPLKDASRAIIYNAPSHSTALFKIKRPSYEKGEYPPHLRPYAAGKTGLNACPRECSGRKGSSYRECLIKCAAERGITGRGRAAKRKIYREMMGWKT